jgi:hypothetical protein
MKWLLRISHAYPVLVEFLAPDSHLELLNSV